MKLQSSRLCSLKGYKIGAACGYIGTCEDFLLDDLNWVINYFVAETKKWFLGRKILIEAMSIGKIDHKARAVNTELTREQVADAPLFDTDANFSHKHYDLSDYWCSLQIAGFSVSPGILSRTNVYQDKENSSVSEPNLRSANDLVGYRISATDCTIGTINDFLIEEGTWYVRYLVLDTRRWLPDSEYVLLDPADIGKVDGANRFVTVGLTGEETKSRLDYNPPIIVRGEQGSGYLMTCPILKTHG